MHYSEYLASLLELIKINPKILFINVTQKRNLFLHKLCLLPWKQLLHNSGVQHNNSFPGSWGDCLYTEGWIKSGFFHTVTANEMGFSITMLSTDQPAQGNLCSNAAKRYRLSIAFVKPLALLRVHVSVLKKACSSTIFPDGNVESATYLLSENILLSLLTPNWLPGGENLPSRDLKTVWLSYCNSASMEYGGQTGKQQSLDKMLEGDCWV